MRRLGTTFAVAVTLWIMWIQAQAQPTITNVYVTATTATTATIQWTTNVPATSQVRYGPNIALQYSTNINQSLVTTHVVQLTVLSASNPYNFAAVSTAGGQSSQSPTYTFALCGVAEVPVAGTVTNYYEYGSYTLTWIPPSGNSTPPTVCGQPVQTPITGLLDGGASFSNQVADAYKVVPGPGQWQVTATDAGNLAPVTIDAYLSSTTQDVSTQLQYAAQSAGLAACITNTISRTSYPSTCGGGGLPAATTPPQIPVLETTGSTTPTLAALGLSLTPDIDQNLEAKGVISSYNGSAFAGDSNTQCLGIGENKYDCWAQMVAYGETGTGPAGPLLLSNGGWESINLIDESWYYLAANQVMPQQSGNAIRHLMIGTNNVISANPTTPAQITQVSQVMYELATWATTGPQEKYFPDDSNYASTTGTWTPQYNFIFLSGISGGTGYTVGDTLSVNGSVLAGFGGTNIVIDQIGVGGNAINYHMAPYPTTGAYSGGVCSTSNTPTPCLTGGTGSGLSFQLANNNPALHVSQSTGATDSITYSNIATDLGCAVLVYQVYPASGNTPNFGAVTGSTFSVFLDGSGTALTDSITGQSVLSSNFSNTEQLRIAGRYQGSYFGFKAARFCGLTTGTHSFAIQKVTGGYEAILALIAPRTVLDYGSDGPNLNVIGVLPICTVTGNQCSSNFPTIVTQYNSIYNTIVHDLRTNMGRRIVYTDDSTVEMVSLPANYWNNSYPATTVTNSALSSGTLTLSLTLGASSSYTAGQIIVPSSLVNCSVANQLPWVVQTVSGGGTSITANLEDNRTATAHAASVATCASGSESTAFTELTQNGYVVNSAFGPQTWGLHMPQLAQIQLARLVQNADRASPGYNPLQFQGLGDTVYGVTGGAPAILSGNTQASFQAVMTEGPGQTAPSWNINPAVNSVTTGSTGDTNTSLTVLGQTSAIPLIQLGDGYKYAQSNQSMLIGNNTSIGSDGNGNLNFGVGYSAVNQTQGAVYIYSYCPAQASYSATAFSIASNVLTVSAANTIPTTPGILVFLVFSGFTGSDAFLNQQGFLITNSTTAASTGTLIGPYTNANYTGTPGTGTVSWVTAYPFSQSNGCTQRFQQGGNVFSFADLTAATSTQGSSNATVQIISHYPNSSGVSSPGGWQFKEAYASGTQPNSTLTLSPIIGSSTGTHTFSVGNLTVTGTCTGCGSISGQTTGYLPKSTSSTASTASSAIDDGATTAATITIHEPLVVTSGGASTIQLSATTVVGSLATCNTAAKGTISIVTDATSPTFLGALTGGGSVVSPVVCNGSSWVSF